MTATTPNAPGTPSTWSPGKTTAAARSPAAARVHPTSTVRIRNRGRWTTQAGLSPPGLSTVPEAWPLIDDGLRRAFPPLRLGLQVLELALERVVERLLEASVEEAGD